MRRVQLCQKFTLEVETREKQAFSSGERFLKSDLQIEAYGCIDDLSSVLGTVASYLKGSRTGSR